MNRESKSILKFILRSLVATWPLLLLIVIYLALDPFGVVFCRHGFQTGSYLPYNKGDISTESYLRGRKDNHYDSFIFGSSRTIRLTTGKWQSYIGNHTSPLHFDASDESPLGIYLKMRLIDSYGDTIKNAIIEISPISVHKPPIGLSYRLPWKLTSVTDAPAFHLSYLKDFLGWNMFHSIIRYKFTGQLPDEDNTVRLLFAKYPVDAYDVKTNEEYYHTADSLIESGEITGRYPLFAESLFNFTEIKSTDYELFSFTEIKRIFDRHRTDYRIILGPDARHRLLPDSFIIKLKEVFDSTKVYDFRRFKPAFSGKMTFYDDIHFTTEIGDALLDSVYSDMNTNNN